MAAFQTAAAALAMPALEGLAGAHPALRVELVEAEAEESLPLLARGALDVVIAEEYEHAPRPRLPGLRRDYLEPDEMLLALPHADGGRSRSPTWRTSAWATARAGTAYADMFDRLCRSVGGFEPDVRYRVNDMRLLLALVAAGRAAAIVPALGRPEGVAVRPIAEGRFSRALFVATRASDARQAVDGRRRRRDPGCLLEDLDRSGWRADLYCVNPSDNRTGWLAGVPLLLLACLVPPFVLFVPIAFALAGLAGLAIARWELLVVPVLVGFLVALDETALGVAWGVMLALGIAAGVGLRLRRRSAVAATIVLGAVGTTAALVILFGGYLNSREGACNDTRALAERHPQAVEFREGESSWGQTCDAIGPAGEVLGRQTLPQARALGDGGAGARRAVRRARHAPSPAGLARAVAVDRVAVEALGHHARAGGPGCGRPPACRCARGRRPGRAAPTACRPRRTARAARRRAAGARTRRRSAPPARPAPRR